MEIPNYQSKFCSRGQPKIPPLYRWLRKVVRNLSHGTEGSHFTKLKFKKRPVITEGWA
jgi:hypothetical protein